MKKLLFIIALVAVYGISISNAATKINISKKSQIVLVADDNGVNNIAIDDNKKKDEKKAEKPACCSEKAKTAEKPATTGCTEAQKKSCATAGKTCEGEKKPEEKK